MRPADCRPCGQPLDMYAGAHCPRCGHTIPVLTQAAERPRS